VTAGESPVRAPGEGYDVAGAPSIAVPGPAIDAPLLEVRSHLLRRLDLGRICGRAIRTAFDEVLDGGRTGRIDLRELDVVEKAYTGTKIAIILRDALGLQRGTELSLSVAVHDVEVLFSTRTGD